MQTFCPMRLKDFPFDVQKCEIALASWMYDVRQLRIVPHPEDASEVRIVIKIDLSFVELLLSHDEIKRIGNLITEQN